MKPVAAYEVNPGDVIGGEFYSLREKVEEVEYWGQTLRFNFTSGRSMTVDIHRPIIRYDAA